MESFRWDEHFVTGWEAVDDQHCHLVGLVNRFGALLAANRLDMEVFDEVFASLAHYASYHFEEEEELWQEVGIDPRHATKHRAAHAGFLDEVTAMRAIVSADNPAAAGRLLDFLTHWLVFHILGSDQDMGRQLRAIEAGVEPEQAFEREERGVASSSEPLLAALNSLFELVSERNKELVRLNQSLEQKVAERTRELEEANRHLEVISMTDVLTGLPNRRHAMHLLGTLWDESTRAETPLVCIMIDADHFKEVNDSYGHEAGDTVLRELAGALRQGFRTDDVVCRLGGDEFFVVCPNTDLEGGVSGATSIQEKVSTLRVPTGSGSWAGSISVGVAARGQHHRDYQALIAEADDGVYAAKRAGRNCVRTVSEAPAPATVKHPEVLRK